LAEKLAASSDADLKEVKRLSKKLAARGTMSVEGWISKISEQDPIRPSEYREPTSIASGKRGAKRPKLTA